MRLATKRLRATRAAAAAPNSRTIGGAGTGDGPPELPPWLDEPWPEEPRLLLFQPLEPCQPLELLQPLDPFELEP